MSLGSRAAFFAWHLYRTSALFRKVMSPRLQRSAEKRLDWQEGIIEEQLPAKAWSEPRPTSGAALRVSIPADEEGSPASARLLALLNHWRTPYEFGCGSSLETDTLQLDAAGLFCIRRGKKVSSDIDGGQEGVALLEESVLSPLVIASPEAKLSREIDRTLGRTDWRDPLPALISVRIDDVSGREGLSWLPAFEKQGILPSLGTFHDEWLASGEKAVRAVVEASKRGCSVSPHAFEAERFIWFDAIRACDFSREKMQEHEEKIARDVQATGLVLGKTLNAHFDVIGETAVDAAHALGFRYALGEHVLGQDWREAPRARDPLGTPLYCYGPLDKEGKLFGYQAEGAIASSAAKRSRYDWLRNFIELDAKTGKPIKESLDREGAIRQGIVQLLSALYAGFPAYLLCHEIHLDALGADVVGDLLDAVLREVKARVPNARAAQFDELPAACAARSRS